MPGKQYKEAKICDCGYTTFESSNWSTHKKRCKLVVTADRELICTLKEQLAAKDEQMMQQLAVKDEQMKEQLAVKDEQMKEQLAAKDRQIEQLIKRPRTVNNNTTNKYVVEAHINTFGKESIEHISPQQIQALLADPANAVPQFIKLKHRRAPNGVNHNVRVPNQKRAIYQVVVPDEEGGKEWENKAKGDVLEQLYDDNS
eukprot:7391573-Prymnesium_polylepis.2